MKSAAVLLISLAVGLAGLIYVTGIRIFVVKGNSVLQRQGTVLVHGMYDSPMVDNPEALCARTGKAGEYCAAGAAVGYLQQAKVITTLPFNQALYDMAP